jgi:uncharacterized protein (DUF433 family)
MYLVGEAAHYLGVPASTVRVWSLGRRDERGDTTRRLPSLIKVATRVPPTLSFWNLVELYLVASIRRRHGVSLQKLRRALKYVEHELGVPRPLIESRFRTDGIDLFVERYAHLINVTDSGQLSLLVAESLDRIAPDAQGFAAKLHPWLLRPNEPCDVALDPLRGFGKLLLAGTGVPTAAVAERFRGGDTIAHLASEYGLTTAQIETALRWEHRGDAA